MSEVSIAFTTSLVQLFSRVRLCDSMICSMPGLPVHHQLPELAHFSFSWLISASPSDPPLSPDSSLKGFQQRNV